MVGKSARCFEWSDSNISKLPMNSLSPSRLPATRLAHPSGIFLGRSSSPRPRGWFRSSKGAVLALAISTMLTAIYALIYWAAVRAL